MAPDSDLGTTQSAQAIKLIGSELDGTESTPAKVDTDQRLFTRTIVQGGAKGTTPFGGDITSENVGPNQQAMHVAILASDGATNKVEMRAREDSGFSPDTSSYINGKLVTLRADAYDNLRTRGQVLSDEGSFRDDFNGASLVSSLIGTATFTNGSVVVTGIGTSFLTHIKIDDYIRLSSDGTQYFAQVKTVDTDLQLTLYSGYLGTSGTGAISRASWNFSSAGTGASISVASSFATIACGTANAAANTLMRGLDYSPLFAFINMSISQRIANQTIIVGLMDNVASPQKFAYMEFTGTNPGQVTFRTGTSSNVADQQVTNVVLPGGKSTIQQLAYEIDLTPTSASLVIEGQVRAVHNEAIPAPYDVMTLAFKTLNAAVVTNTNILLHVAFTQSINQLQVVNSFKGEPLKVQLVGAPGSTISGFSDGKYRNSTSLPQLIQAIPAFAPVMDGKNSITAYPYIEQSSNAQRSFVSTSANDTAAGTGLRSVKLTYYDNAGIGPFYESVTLNGTTAVNTVNTNICFIERIDSELTGSLGYAAGNILLKAAAAGAGVTIGAILLGATRTFWCHHYVAAGYTLFITSATVGTTGTVAGNGGTFFITAKRLGIANAVTRQVSDTFRVPGSVASNYRGYDTAIEVVGPARVVGNVANTASATYECYMAFGYYEA